MRPPVVPYQPRPDDFRAGGQWLVPLRDAPAVRRPSRLAAGMSYTLNRTGTQTGELLARRSMCRGTDTAPRSTRKPDVLQLIVRGTTDCLRGFTFDVEKMACPCCGAKQGGRLRLTSRGRLRLAHARRRAAARGFTIHKESEV